MPDLLTLPLTPRASRALARVAVLVALVLCVWKAVGLLWLLLSGPHLPVGVAATGLPNLEAPAPSGELAKWHLFGDVQGRIDLAALAQANMQETALKLTLRGTFNETRPEGGIAIIADEQGTDRSYRVGDTLPGGAQLEEILTGVVVLARAGVRETLSLRLTDAADSRAGVGPSQARGQPARAPLPGGSQVGSTPMKINPVIAPGGPDLQTWRTTNLPDAQELAKQVQVFPVTENGRMRGVRLSAGRDSDVLSRAGLKPTDIVTAVNGVPLDGPARQFELLSNLREARQVNLSVERDGKTIQLQFGP